jgi:hypothetical protein
MPSVTGYICQYSLFQTSCKFFNGVNGLGRAEKESVKRGNAGIEEKLMIKEPEKCLRINLETQM